MAVDMRQDPKISPPIAGSRRLRMPTIAAAISDHLRHVLLELDEAKDLARSFKNTHALRSLNQAITLVSDVLSEVEANEY
jgi:hypothetical protein